MKRVSKVLMIAVALVAAGVFGASAAAQDGKPGATVEGRWTLTVDGGAHGMTTMGLSLKQAGARVTGTFANPHGETPVEGEFSGGTLKLATTGAGHEGEIAVSFTATLKDDGTLSGFMSSAMGDMRWTATRAKDK